LSREKKRKKMERLGMIITIKKKERKKTHVVLACVME
jgi:hypothetical protein